MRAVDNVKIVRMDEVQRGKPQSVTVVIVSWCRPDYVRSCLAHLAELTRRPDEVIVVDASPDDGTAAVVNEFPHVLRVPFAGGAGHLTTSRNVGLLHASGDVIAFIDDDAYVRRGWLTGILEAFANPTIGAVAGRTCNGIPGEESEGLTEIGRVLPSGDLTGYFAADPGATIEVDHGIGANMSFRRQALARLGGFRDDFFGVGAVREDTDIFLRLRALGYRAVFAPAAVVDHVGAPHVRGRRFDFRYLFWARHNHALLLARNFGLGSSQFRAWVATELGRALTPQHPNPLRRAVRIALGLAAVAAGMAASVWKSRWRASDPARRDAIGQRISAHLSGVATTCQS
jgi:GT2 family glycosyltransferase